MSTSPYVKCFAFIVNPEQKLNLSHSTDLFLSPRTAKLHCIEFYNKYKYLLCYLKTAHSNRKIQALHASKLEKNGYSADIAVRQFYPLAHRHSFARSSPSILETPSAMNRENSGFLCIRWGGGEGLINTPLQQSQNHILKVKPPGLPPGLL